MNYGEYRAAVPQRYRLVAGVAVAALLGALLALQNQAIFEWVAAQSALPERHAETGNRLTSDWAWVYFAASAALPLLLAYLLAGRGWSGWGGALAYLLGWWAVATTVPTGPRAAQFQLWALLPLLLVEFARHGSGEGLSSPLGGAGDWW